MEELLLHICCGPCSLFCIDDLKQLLEGQDVALTGYFTNPNIHPYDEFMRRQGTARAACAYKQIPLLIDDTYDFAKWEAFQSSHAERCEMCYTVRAVQTAKKAAERNCRYFTSTLFVSPYQNHGRMKELFENAGKLYGVEFLYRDFRPGFRSGQEQARSIGLYRQKYCGCMKSFYGE